MPTIFFIMGRIVTSTMVGGSYGAVSAAAEIGLRPEFMCQVHMLLDRCFAAGGLLYL